MLLFNAAFSKNGLSVYIKCSLHYEPAKRPYESDGSLWKTVLQPRSGQGDTSA